VENAVFELSADVARIEYIGLHYEYILCSRYLLTVCFFPCPSCLLTNDVDYKTWMGGYFNLKPSGANSEIELLNKSA